MLVFVAVATWMVHGQLTDIGTKIEKLTLVLQHVSEEVKDHEIRIRTVERPK